VSFREIRVWTKPSARRTVSRVKKPVKIQWLAELEEHDYPAALAYLSLIHDDRNARRFLAALKAAPVTQFKAKDIFRASGLSLLGTSNSHVEKDRAKIRAGQKLSPILLVRDSDNEKVIIADGYHRLCAVYSFDEDALIPCKIV
jgi:thiamine pyrophosphate-dependent acetolactate synthase large subunit-like protein